MDKRISILVQKDNCNCLDCFYNCLESISQQTYKNMEIIIINNQANECELKYVKKCMNGNTICLEQNSNLSFVKSIYYATQKATGDYIIFIDGNDYISIDFCRLLMNAAKKNDADVIFSSTVYETAEGKKISIMQDVSIPDSNEEDKRIFDLFIEQEGRCKPWYTIWNKMYKKSLWNMIISLLLELESDSSTIIFEDIAFSFLLFFYTNKVARANNSIYYKNTKHLLDVKFCYIKEKIKNLNIVFNFLNKTIGYKGASEYQLSKCDSWRQYQLRHIKNEISFIDNIHEKQMLEKMIDISCIETDEDKNNDNFFVETYTIFNQELENIKKKMINSNYEYISFDIFDTLINKPFSKSEHLFYLMDKYYEKEIYSNVSFHNLRINGEVFASDKIKKNNINYQEVIIDEIYECINEYYGLDKCLCNKLKDIEKKLQVKFCIARETMKELFELALYLGKKTVIISDTYLDKITIEEILRKNGYLGWTKVFLSSEERKIKSTGDLYKEAIKQLKTQADKMLHFGHDFEKDIKIPEKLGISSVYIPNTMTLFSNLQTPKMSDPLVDYEYLVDSIGFGCLTSIVANFYFDNPFRSFNSESNLNGDPYFIGYYILGMHLIGLVTWIIKESASYNKILFMARDGYLVKKAYDIVVKNCQSKPKSEYIQISRKMMLPFLINNYSDFMNFPSLNLKKTCPDILFDLLNFCTKNISDEEKYEFYNEIGITGNTYYRNHEEYYNFIKTYYERFYDKEKHDYSKELLRKYYKDISDNNITFDLGHYGRVQSALIKATETNIDAMFLFSDSEKSIGETRKNKFKVKTFYDFYPIGNRSFREHILSSNDPSCIGLQLADNEIKPIYDKYKKSYTDIFVKQKIHNGALQFVEDYYCIFDGFIDDITFKSFEISLPFEIYLKMPNNVDLKIFTGSYFDGTFNKKNIFDEIKKDCKRL